MPDIWTHHPEIVRDLLREAGFTCGVDPRILKDGTPTGPASSMARRSQATSTFTRPTLPTRF